MKQILTLLVFLSSIALACPNQSIHDDVQIAHKEKWIKIESKRLIVYEKKIIEVSENSSRIHGYGPDKYYWGLWHTFRYYAKQHNLEVVYR